jgi:hypothetical protein
MLMHNVSSPTRPVKPQDSEFAGLSCMRYAVALCHWEEFWSTWLFLH